MKQQMTCPECKGQQTSTTTCKRCGGHGIVVVTVSEENGSDKPRITRIIQE